MKLLKFESMKYAIVLAVVVASYSFVQCYQYLAHREPVGFFKSVYCSIGFFQFIPRQFSALDFFVHLFLWVVISLALYRVYLWFFGGRLP
jgi:hypothetical protein